MDINKELLEKYAGLSENELDRLLLKQDRVEDQIILRDVVGLLKLRLKAAGKFSKANEMFFTSDGLEQATGETMANYIADEFRKHLEPGSTIVEVACGIGGNTLALAKYFKVIAIDNDEEHIDIAKENVKVYGVQDNVRFICGEAEEVINGIVADGFFFDPQRIREGETKTRSILNSNPPVDKVLPMLLDITQNGCIKISPAYDKNEVEHLIGSPAIEVVSQNNTNKLGLLWFGVFKNFLKKATWFQDEVPASIKTDKLVPPTAPVAEDYGKYIYELNNAIIKTNMINEVANYYGLQKIGGSNIYLTSDKLLHDKNLPFRPFEIISSKHTSLKPFKKELKDSGITQAEIKTRSFQLKPEELRKKLKINSGGENVIIATKNKTGETSYILARKL